MTRDRLGRRVLLINFLVAMALVWPVQAFAAGGQWVEGRLRLAHGENFATHQAYWDYELATDQGTYRLDFGGEGPEAFLNGAQVRVHGYSKADHVLAVGNNSVEAQVVSPATVVASASTKKIALLLVNFVTNPAEPWTTTQAYNAMFADPSSVANYFGEESYGQATVIGDVLGYYTIDYDTATCNYSDLAAKAKSAATAAGVVLSSYTNFQYAFPSLPCGWSGLAYLPGTESWLNNALTLRVSAHELSHNFGVHHASTISCTESGVRVALSANTANCTYSEYGDPFSIMGSASTRHTHNQQLVQMGWISTSQTPTVSVSGTYALGAAEDPSANPKALRVARGNGTYLYLELREPWGSYFDTFGPTDPAVTGVTLRFSNDWTSIIQSKLIDSTPATSTYLDAPLAVGASFTDPVSGVTVTTTSVSAGVAMVQFSWGPDGVSPSTPTNPSATKTGTSTATFSWSASTDNVGVAGYEVSRDTVVLGTTTATNWPDSGLVGGQAYTYSVRAYDAAGNWSGAASLIWTQPTSDTTAPTAPGNLQGTVSSKNRIALSWIASTDNVGVAGYRIFRNGLLWVTTTGLSYTGSRQNRIYTYTVVAFDAAGNPSGASNPVTK